MPKGNQNLDVKSGAVPDFDIPENKVLETLGAYLDIDLDKSHTRIRIACDFTGKSGIRGSLTVAKTFYP